MDTASGSIRDSEPTSPTSPASPAGAAGAPAPALALQRALSSLHRGQATDPSERGADAGWGAAGLVDSEALIALDLCLVKGDGGSEDLRIANILFNNLDIIGECQNLVRTSTLLAAYGPRRLRLRLLVTGRTKLFPDYS